jgi:hypothetical protein
MLGTIVGVRERSQLSLHINQTRRIQLASRIANGTGFTVRCKQRENVVTADYFTSASIPAITATGTTTTSLTLTGDDMKTFGSLVQGRPAFSWVPMASGAKGQNLNANRMEVADISIKNVFVGEQTLTSSTSVVRINQTPALIRVKGKMKIEDSDFTSAAAAGTVTELECADTTLKSKVAMRNINSTSPAQPANVTPPASGAAYINLDAYPQDIVWSGGTLTTPFVEVSTDDGTTWVQVWFENGGGALTSQPGDQIRWTYSSAPTIRKIPRK